MKIDNILSLLKPKQKGESDKYSWNFYRYLAKYPRSDIRICFYQKSLCDGEPVEFDKCCSMRPSQIFILFGGDSMSGQRMDNLMRAGEHSKIETFSFCLWDKTLFQDITEWFFTEYLRIGRCIFDREHNGWWRGGDGRYAQINRNSRRCNWCGEYQRRSIKKVATIERKVLWKRVV